MPIGAVPAITALSLMVGPLVVGFPIVRFCTLIDCSFPAETPAACSRAAAGGLEPGFAARPREIAHPKDVALPLGHRDDAAGIEQVEHVARLDALVIGRQRHQVTGALAVPTGVEIFAARRLLP